MENSDNVYMLILLCFILFLFSKCSTFYSHKNMAGFYTSKRTYETMLLKEDGTFVAYKALYFPVASPDPKDKVDLNKDAFFDTVEGCYEFIGHGTKFMANPKQSYCETTSCDTCQFLTIKVCKTPYEYTRIELYNKSSLQLDTVIYNDMVTIKNVDIDSLIIQYDLHTKVLPNTNTISAYITRKYSNWKDEWIILSRRKIKYKYNNDSSRGVVFKKTSCGNIK